MTNTYTNNARLRTQLYCHKSFRCLKLLPQIGTTSTRNNRNQSVDKYASRKQNPFQSLEISPRKITASFLKTLPSNNSLS